MPADTARRSGLRQRILLALLAYVVLLSLAVVAQGLIVNERAEQLIWQALLEPEMDHLQERMQSDPGYRWANTRNLTLYDGSRPGSVPAELRALAPGIHDDLRVGDTVCVVLVRQVQGRPLMLALDIGEFEEREFDMGLTVAGSAITLVLLLGLAIFWGVNRLMRPLGQLAKRIGGLQPDLPGQRIQAPEAGSGELVVIAEALNDYLQRNDRFVERERVFIDTASHELRTPVAVIAGASELALQQPDLSAATRGQIARIRRTARDVEQLISLLLVLAKDPQRLSQNGDRVALDQLLPEILEDHRYLTCDKALTLTLGPMPACEIVAPLPIVQAAIGNLLRNSIENSDRGEIVVRLEAPATVVIEDPGHGMTPEEISAIYARMARGGGDRSGGIGLDLISRLCEHLDWRLSIASDHGLGTTTTLTFA